MRLVEPRRMRRVALAVATAIMAVTLALAWGARSAAAAGNNIVCEPAEESLEFNTTGEYNTACGYQALHFNTEGLENVASGARALRSNTSGSHNTANGADALFSNTEGSYNAAN